MYADLDEQITERDQETDESCYPAKDMEAFRVYLILAEADEMRRYHAMSFKLDLSISHRMRLNAFIIWKMSSKNSMD